MMTIRNTWIGLLLLTVVLTRGEFSINLGDQHVPNMILIRIQEGGGGEQQHNNHTTERGCSTLQISDLYPEPTIDVILKGHESKEQSQDEYYFLEPVVVTIYNSELDRVCETQRKQLVVTKNPANERMVRIYHSCHDCSNSYDTKEAIRIRDATLTGRSDRASLVGPFDSSNEVFVHSIHPREEQIRDDGSLEVTITISPDGVLVSEQREQPFRVPPLLDSRELSSNKRARSGEHTASKLTSFHATTTDTDSSDHIPSSSLSSVVSLSSIGVESNALPTSSAPRTIAGMGCSLLFDECCSDSDCAASDNICVGRTCIDQGYPRFTLAWFGDDDYDLYVVTPSEFVLSFQDDLDEETGGRVGEPIVQDSAGYHVENVYFPINGSAPMGTYQFYVRPLTTIGVAEEWRLTVVDETGEVTSHTGRRFSPVYEYIRSGSPTTNPLPSPTTSHTVRPNSSPTSRPLPSPTTSPTDRPEPSPVMTPDVRRPYSQPFELPCDLLLDECCADSDCLFAGEVCFNRNCIDDGNPRITLSWVGDDDLDLFVVTPAGIELSFMNFFDPVSGGRFGEDVDQFGTGHHVENVYFPMAGAPYGNYQFFVRPLTTVEERDVWTLTVVENGSTIISETGTGPSARFSYHRGQPEPTPPPTLPPPVAKPTLPPISRPTPTEPGPTHTRSPQTSPTSPPQTMPVEPPSRPPQVNSECNPFFDECCESSDCRTSRDVCEQRTCIRDGNPRFTLTWDGDVDFDLLVFTPDGIEISQSNTFDIFSGGRFEMDPNLNQSGKHVESVYFPLLGTPVGVYKYEVRSTNTMQFSDNWTLEVYDGGELVRSNTDSGSSEEFEYDKDETTEGPQRPTPSPPRCSPISDECCLDSDCEGDSSICVQRTCIDDGSPRITLRWTGDDDLNLFVETPSGVVLSGVSQIDPATGGRHQESPDQTEYGFHVENVYFPADRSEAGSYKYFVESAEIRGVGADVWRIGVYEEGESVEEVSGIGDSREFDYERLEGAPPPSPPSPTPPGTCSPLTDECCRDLDCDSGHVCANRNCVGEGNPRVTLTWTGDDDLDLYLRTPLGNIIYYGNRIDVKTRGIFDTESEQTTYGFHTENIFFPLTGSPLGDYTAAVRVATSRGTPDDWTVRFFDGGVTRLAKTGTGDSEFFSYNRKQVGPTPPMVSPTSPPVLSPVTERPPPGQSPVTDRDCPHECCSDTDCGSAGEICVQRTCVMDGTPRFTLTWTGNDDLSLVVVTPGGKTISYLNPTDSLSGGIFGEDSNQSEFGFHVENIFFPQSGGPDGEYKYFVKSTAKRGQDDRWALRVFVEGELVAWRTGTGESRTYTYGYGAIVIMPTTVPTASPVMPPFTVPPVDTRLPVAAPTTESCQVDSQCSGAGEICIQQTCISDGNPRFTLIWSGNDDLDFFVETPDGAIISKLNPFDPQSGGIFGETGDQTGFDRYVENIFFPLGPSGTYTYYVRSTGAQGSDDFWQASVSVDGESQVVRTGSGDSTRFTFEFDNEDLTPTVPTPAPVAPDCTNNSQCPSDEVCAREHCVENGNPRVSLTWIGDDDLDLFVVTPTGVTISFSNPVDPLSSGRFGDSGGIQTTFGKHVENVYFPGDAPPGMYTFFAKTYQQRGSADLWHIDAVANGAVVAAESGIGDSDSFTFNFEEGVSPSPVPPGSFPTQAPTPGSFCDPTAHECCSDMQCLGSELCTQRTCIDEGTPRFTLTWTGNDDLDLVVQTPLGTFVSFLQPYDEASGGRFGDGGDQFEFGRHVENVYFPLEGSPLGSYNYFVRSFLPVDDDDVWTVNVFVNGQSVASTTGTGDSGTKTYDYSGSVPTPPPVPDPTPPPTRAPQSQPTVPPGCSIFLNECCTDSDCITGVETCVETQCIDLGNPRFTLTWTGDDDLDLKVETPLGSTISFIEPVDEASGGVYGEDGSQFVFGGHVENIYFKEEGPTGGAPIGVYKYSVDSFFERGGNDRWTVTVFVDNREVASQTGFGDSVEFTYDFQGGGTGPDLPPPTCEPDLEECCEDSDCTVGQEVCVQRTCIDRGNPRFTLTWTGDDDLDLTVVTPFGTTLAVASPSDPISGGVFGEEGDQLSFGRHVENVYFPLDGGPSGTYTFIVASFDEVGAPDDWSVSVFVDDAAVMTQAGTGTSDFFVFEYDDGFTLSSAGSAAARSSSNAANPLEVSMPTIGCDAEEEECCHDSDCTGPATFCLQRQCIEEGNPRFTLTWNGNDDYDLLVTPPIGRRVSFEQPIDYESGGRFGEQGGIQSHPGLHAENVFFPLKGGPLGTYTINVHPFQLVDDEDTWTLGVFVDGKQVQSFTGFGDSGSLDTIQYEYTSGGILSEEVSQIPSCSLGIDECCDNVDCPGEMNKCLQQSCIPVRTDTPMIILTWVGDDDLDLTVTTPSGAEISYYLQRDEVSGAFFEQSDTGASTNERTISLYQSHSEQVSISPRATSSAEDAAANRGIYRYKVSSFNVIGLEDQWTTQVFVNGTAVSTHTGTGDSEEFTVEIGAISSPFSSTTTSNGLSNGSPLRVAEHDPANSSILEATNTDTNAHNCGGPSDCSSETSTCLAERCLDSGPLQFTLIWWDGDGKNDDLELSIWAPDSTLYQSLTYGELTPSTSTIPWESIDEEGLHIRNFVFSQQQAAAAAAAAVAGKYKFSITTTRSSSGEAATMTSGGWQLWIHENGQEVFQQSSESSASSFFGYEYHP